MRAIFVSVRTGSTRLPRKALKKIREKTTIEYLIDRVKKSAHADKIVLCTTELSEDDALCEIATRSGIEFFWAHVRNMVLISSSTQMEMTSFSTQDWQIYVSSKIFLTQIRLILLTAEAFITMCME